MSWRRRLIFAAIAIALGGGAFIYLRFAPVTVQVAQPSANVTVRVFGLGTVEARVLTKVGFEVGAVITELNADHGDRVKKGAALARLHGAEQEAKVNKAKAGVASAEADVKKAEANIAKAQAVLLQRQEANRRKQQLAGRQIVAEQSAEEALRDEEVAKADLSVAQSESAVALARLEDARAQYELEKTILDHHVLYAPFDALVVERHKEIGSVIKAGDTIFTLVDPETVWGMAYVDESRSGAIREGQEAEVRLRSLPQQVFKAKVMRIGIESDRVTEERRVYVKCEQCPPHFHLGEQIEVLITVGTLGKALLVPETALNGYDGRSAKVWTVESGRLVRRSVTLGLRTENSLLEVTGGVPDGAQIAIGVPASASEGRRVRTRAE